MFQNKEKEILAFPKPFGFTPYEKDSFSFNVNELSESYSQVSLKVCKIIILGDLHVGKTALLNRFCYKIFDSNYRSTIGVDFQTQQVNVFGVPYHLQIWDTAGQERFKCIAQCYYRKAHVIIVVFDLSTIRTLAGCNNWLTDALHVCEPRPYIFLVGTKKDLISSESYKNVEEIALSSAKKMEAEFWSVSAKTGENVDEVFLRAAALCFDDDFSTFLTEDCDHTTVRIGNDLIYFYKREKKTPKKCNEIKCSKN